jgi:hypothetical protein
VPLWYKLSVHLKNFDVGIVFFFTVLLDFRYSSTISMSLYYL